MARLLVCVLTASVLSAACAAKGPELPPVSEFPGQGQPASVVTHEAGAAPVALRFTPTAATRDERRMVMQMTITGSAHGESLDQKMTVTQTLVSTIDDVKPDGTFRVTSVTRDTSLELGGPAAEEMKKAGMDPSGLAQAMDGLKATVTLDARGQALAAELSGLFDTTSGPLAGIDALMKGTAVLPAEPVGVGARWDTLAIVDVLGTPTRFMTSYELVALEGTRGKVKVALRGGLAQGRRAAAGELKMTTFELEGGGTMTFDQARPTANESDITLAMSAAVEGGSMKVDGRVTVTAP